VSAAGQRASRQAEKARNDHLVRCLTDIDQNMGRKGASMTIQLPMDDFSAEQRELWRRVNDLWALARERDEGKIRSTLHPDYKGWDMTTPLPHDRDAAVLSVSGDSPELREYELKPLSVHVYEGKVGIVHYSYSAMVVPKGAAPVNVTGRWSEVYLKQDGTWIMISVSGWPDVAKGGDRAESV
jgi:hypothetical protein